MPRPIRAVYRTAPTVDPTNHHDRNPSQRKGPPAPRSVSLLPSGRAAVAAPLRHPNHWKALYRQKPAGTVPNGSSHHRVNQHVFRRPGVIPSNRRPLSGCVYKSEALLVSLLGETEVPRVRAPMSLSSPPQWRNHFHLLHDLPIQWLT